MRQITAVAAEAFFTDRTMKVGNTEVRQVPSGHLMITELLLHGNRIAWKPTGCTNNIMISAGGWTSNTTKERLTGILWRSNTSVKLVQKNWLWYLVNNDTFQQWDGTPIHLNDFSASI